VSSQQLKRLITRGADRTPAVRTVEEEKVGTLRQLIQEADDRIFVIKNEAPENYIDPRVARRDWTCSNCAKKGESYWGCKANCESCQFPERDLKCQKEWIVDNGKRSYTQDACKWCDEGFKPDRHVLLKEAGPWLWRNNKAAINNMAECQLRAKTSIDMNKKWVAEMENKTATDQEASLPEHWEMVEAPSEIEDDDSDIELERIPKKSYMATLENSRTTQNEEALRQGKSLKRHEREGSDEGESETHFNRNAAPWHRARGATESLDGRLRQTKQRKLRGEIAAAQAVMEVASALSEHDRKREREREQQEAAERKTKRAARRGRRN